MQGYETKHGGIALVGSHIIKSWAATQKTITLSSTEAELGGIIKATTEGIGMRSLPRDIGFAVDLEVHADASAAIGICRRSGVGRVRHLAVGLLWIQNFLREGGVKLFKVPGEVNVADLCTKYLSGPTLQKFLKLLPVRIESERAQCAPTIAPLEGKGVHSLSVLRAGEAFLSSFLETLLSPS